MYTAAHHLLIWFGHPAEVGDAECAVETMLKLKAIFIKHAEEWDLRFPNRGEKGLIYDEWDVEVQEDLDTVDI